MCYTYFRYIFDKPAGNKRADGITALSTLPYDGIKIEGRYMDDRYTDDQMTEEASNFITRQ